MAKDIGAFTENFCRNRMDLIEHWRKRLATGMVRFDDQLLEIRRAGTSGSAFPWGTLLYSEAREQYKTKVSQDDGNPSFDIELMKELEIQTSGDLVVAANPNSLFEGHLVIYPKVKSPRLTFCDILEITKFAFEHQRHTVIHNMKDSAASITDWAHFQSYPISFPIESEQMEFIGSRGSLQVARISPEFPAFALVAEYDDVEIVSRWLFQLLDLLFEGAEPIGRPIPVNFIWKANRIWIVPRSADQTKLAAQYFGGLEIGGIFCLPNADELRNYLPRALKQTIIDATFRSEPLTQLWFEENALRLLQGDLYV